MNSELTQQEREEIKAEAHEQVAYEKTVVDSMVMKSRYVIETLQAGGYCEEHIENMIQPIMLASVLQQISDVMLDIRAAQDEVIANQRELVQQLEIIDLSICNLNPNLPAEPD